MVKVALYARVSKGFEQTADNQLFALRNWLKNNPEFIVEGEYVDEISSRKTRPMRELVVKKMRSKEVDGVIFVRLDRWGRSSTELAFFIEEAASSNWKVISLKEGFDISTPAGRLMAGMIGLFANFERDMIRDRTIEGLQERKDKGIILGRPKGSKDKKKRKEKTPPVKTGWSPYGAKS